MATSKSSSPLGDYVAVISADGYVTATEEFTLDMAGEVEVNEVNLEEVDVIGETPMGTLVKGLIIPEFDMVQGILDGTISLNTEVLFCDGVITDTTDCDEPTDAAAVVSGGFDDYIAPDDPFFPFGDLDDALQDFGVFLITAEVPAGDYTICMGVSLTGDLDADPLTPDATLDGGFNCENESNLQIVGTDLEDFELAEGQITVLRGRGDDRRQHLLVARRLRPRRRQQPADRGC